MVTRGIWAMLPGRTCAGLGCAGGASVVVFDVVVVVAAGVVVLLVVLLVLFDFESGSFIASVFESVTSFSSAAAEDTGSLASFLEVVSSF